MIRRAAIFLCVLLAPQIAIAQARHHEVDRLIWLAGCWRQTNATTDRVVDEQWMEPRGGTMLGMSRTIRADSLVEFEQLQILERKGSLIYRAAPSGQPGAEFAARSVTDSLVIFENAAHDFPQRIIYHRRGADSLVARIEGARNGRVRGIAFPYARVICR